MKIKLLSISFFCIVLILDCSSNMNQRKINLLYSAILYKESKCEDDNKCKKENKCRPTNPPLGALFVAASKASSFALDACTFAILKQECPFDSYSLVCLEIFSDIPGLGP